MADTDVVVTVEVRYKDVDLRIRKMESSGNPLFAVQVMENLVQFSVEELGTMLATQYGDITRGKRASG